MSGEQGAVPPEYRSPQAEALLRQAIELIEQARPMPLSASSMISKDEVLAVLQAAAQALTSTSLGSETGFFSGIATSRTEKHRKASSRTRGSARGAFDTECRIHTGMHHKLALFPHGATAAVDLKDQVARIQTAHLGHLAFKPGIQCLQQGRAQLCRSGFD